MSIVTSVDCSSQRVKHVFLSIHVRSKNNHTPTSPRALAEYQNQIESLRQISAMFAQGKQMVLFS